MAGKPGARDMRCNDAVLSAFLCSPRYRSRRDFIDAGVRTVKRGDWAFAWYLPPASARLALLCVAGDIAKRQQRSGLWFRRHAEAHSYRILRALKHAGMLEPLLRGGQLRYDPFQSFAASAETYGLIVRKNVSGALLPGDAQLQTKLISDTLRPQDKDGSWGGTVARTALQIGHLLELGCDSHDEPIQRGARWILGQFRETVERRRPNVSWGIAVKDVFTAADSGAEFRGASESLPFMRLAGSCFCALPTIQTALALRVLSTVGFADDPRVIKAYECLLDLRIKPEDVPSLLPGGTPGDWCAHKCRFKLEARAKAERAAIRTSRRKSRTPPRAGL